MMTTMLKRWKTLWVAHGLTHTRAHACTHTHTHAYYPSLPSVLNSHIVLVQTQKSAVITLPMQTLSVVVFIVVCLFLVSFHSEVHSCDDESSEPIVYWAYQTPDGAAGTQWRIWAGEWTTPTWHTHWYLNRS